MYRLASYSLWYILIVSACVSQSLDQCKYITIPICDERRSVSQVIAENSEHDSRVQYGAGLPGKRGPSGPRGQKGDKGDTGSPGIDGRNISGHEVAEIIEAKVQERLLATLEMTGGDFCKSATAGVYSVNGDLYSCDGHGWTIIQARIDGSVNFDRSWIEYRLGFGDIEGNFWLGLDKIRKVVRGKSCQLKLHVETFDGQHGYANYSVFSIGDEGVQFQLLVGGYSGNTGDCFGTFHNGMKFTTKDHDNDLAGSNCAVKHGGWWHKNCFRVSLNAPWGRSSGNWLNIVFYSYKGSNEAMKSASMKVKCD